MLLRTVFLAAALLLFAAGAPPGSGAAADPGRPGAAADIPLLRAGSIIEPACMFEFLDSLGSYWNLGFGLLGNGEPGTDCYNLAVAGDALAAIESMLTYSMCVMRQAEEPDEQALRRRDRTRKMILILYEFLYIIELLNCYSVP